MNIVIVLGAQNDRDGNLSDMAVQRAEGAIREHRNRRNAKLLLTSSYGHFNTTSRPHAYYLAQYLQSRGVPQDDILLFVESVNTVEDAAFSKQALANFRFESICVVTSEFHVPRARLIFEHFFAPNILEFAGTPNGVSGIQLQQHKKHEEAAMAKIISQGGVLFDGNIYPHKGNRMDVEA